MKKITIVSIVLFIVSIFMFAASTIAVSRSFTDVSTSDWFYEDAMKMAEWGVIEGYPDGSFGPGNSINRAELSAMWNRYDVKVTTGDALIYTLDSAKYPIIAANILSNNLLTSAMNNLHGTKYDSTCQFIPLLKDAGEASLDIAKKFDSEGQIVSHEEADADKVEFVELMDEFFDECEAVWL